MPRTLSEADSKALLSQYDIPFAPEKLVTTPDDAGVAAERLGMPVAAKLCGDNIAHKTERGLVRLGLDSRGAVEEATAQLLDAASPEDMATGVLISPMVSGTREFIAGMNHDPQFGATIVFGVGGVLTEVLDDAAVRLAPIGPVDASELIDSIRNRALLDDFRGEPAVDSTALGQILLALSRLSSEHPEVRSVDLNPLIIHDGAPVAVDALVEVHG